MCWLSSWQYVEISVIVAQGGREGKGEIRCTPIFTENATKIMY
jgi:hypothetical protein